MLVASSTIAVADPGPNEDPNVIVGGGQVMNTTELKLPDPDLSWVKDLEITNGTVSTSLGGGVTAWSTAGLQWQMSCCLRWVWGLTKSETSTSIQEIEAHGALLSETRTGNPPPPCYEGNQHWTPSLVRYNTYIADSGWGPSGGAQTGRWDQRCYIMATGHYYIYNDFRTDVNPVDVRLDFCGDTPC
jgi:hypothetical protein